jgi:hypothetical protein
LHQDGNAARRRLEDGRLPIPVARFDVGPQRKQAVERGRLERARHDGERENGRGAQAVAPVDVRVSIAHEHLQALEARCPYCARPREPRRIDAEVHGPVVEELVGAGVARNALAEHAADALVGVVPGRQQRAQDVDLTVADAQRERVDGLVVSCHVFRFALVFSF